MGRGSFGRAPFVVPVLGKYSLSRNSKPLTLSRQYLFNVVKSAFESYLDLVIVGIVPLAKYFSILIFFLKLINIIIYLLLSFFFK